MLLIDFNFAINPGSLQCLIDEIKRSAAFCCLISNSSRVGSPDPGWAEVMMQGQTVREMAVDKPLMTTKQRLSLMWSYKVEMGLQD